MRVRFSAERRLGSLAAATLLCTCSVLDSQRVVMAQNQPGASRIGNRVNSVAIAGQDAYILGPGDQIQLTMLDPGASELGGNFELLNDGSASLALIGNVVLDGLTLNQANRWLQSLYKQYLLRPELNLRVVRPRPMQVSILGEVEKPGLYTLTPSEGSQVEGANVSVSGLPTVVSALQKAGGLTLTADLSNVKLQRRIPGNSQQLREAQIDLAALLKTGDKSQNPFLFDGDTLVIGKAINPDSEVMELAATNLAPQTISVNVIGEVKAPGRISVPASTPLVEAILLAGGPATWRAKRTNVELVRINRNGTATRELFDIDYTQGVNSLRNPPLRDGDTVVVNRSNYAVVVDALDAIVDPVTGLVNAWGLVYLIRDR